MMDAGYRRTYLDEKSELYKDQPHDSRKKRKFNAFIAGAGRRDGVKTEKADKKRDNKNKRRPNQQLMTFEGANGLDADTIKVKSNKWLFIRPLTMQSI